KGIKLCNKSDPHFNQCLEASIPEGIRTLANGKRELGIPNLVPLLIDKIEINADSKQPNSLTQKVQKRCHLWDARYVHDQHEVHNYIFLIDLDKDCYWQVDVHHPQIKMESDYEIKGQFITFPINSHGKCNITMKNMANTQHMTCERYTKDGETYLRLKTYTIQLTSEDVSFYFSDVFPQNEHIAVEVNKVLKENSVAVFNDLKPGFEKAFSSIFKEITNSVFSKIPMKYIFPE
ncbi:hypothetical protein NQ317_018245, partial [Molorchus minor]